MPSRSKKQETKNKILGSATKVIGTLKKVRNISRSATSRILLRKELVADGSPNLDTVPKSALNLLATGMSSVAFKLSFESGSIILKRSRIANPERELVSSDTLLKRELAFYKFIDGLPVLEQQFLARCYDWRVYDKCLYAGMGLRAADPLKPAAEPGVCLDMLLEYKGPSLADWLNARYLKQSNMAETKTFKKPGVNGSALGKLGIQIGGKRYPPKESYRLLYSIFWQLAIIFKTMAKKGWQHMDAHPHNITVVNGLTLASGARINYSPLKVSVPTDLIPTEIVYRLEQPPAPNIIPVSQQLPTQGIQIALIDYNLVRSPDFPQAERNFIPYGTKLISEEGYAARNLELKRRVLALVFGEHKMMAEVKRRNLSLRNYRVIGAANSIMIERYPEEWQELVIRLSNCPDRTLLGYPEYLTNTRNKAGFITNIPDPTYKFKMLNIWVEKEIFWLWQINHAAEVCSLYGFDTTYSALLPSDRVMELFFGAETRTPDDLIIWCCEKLGVRAPAKPVSASAQSKPVTASAQSKRPSLAQKNEAE